MHLLRTALVLLLVPPLTGLCALVAILAGLTRQRWLAELATQVWAAGSLAVCGVRVTPLGTEHLDPSRRYILVANHISMLDIPVIIRAWPAPVRFVAKKGLFSVPIFGQAMLALGHVPVDRGNREQAKASLSKAVERARREVNILFFAEGTRSVDGQLGRFKKGALVMAENTGLPVLPVGVVGTNEVLRKGTLIFRGGQVAVGFGRALEHLADAGLSREARLTELREAVAVQIDLADGARVGTDLVVTTEQVGS